MIDEISRQLKERVQVLPPLCPTQIWKPELSLQISDSSDSELFGNEAAESLQREMRLACRAGLLLMNDDLKASHDYSQQIESSTGSFWHAIMHRREGDFSNANYWWRKTGNHPVFPQIYAAATCSMQGDEDENTKKILMVLERAGTWQPMEFVAACERIAPRDSPLCAVQFAEMCALLNWCRAQI